MTSLAAGKYSEAEEAFRKVHELEPENSRGIANLARVYSLQKKDDEAIRLLQAKVKEYPMRVDYRVLLGDVAVQATKYDLALQQYLFVLTRIDNSSKFAGDLYYRIGKTDLLKGSVDFSIISLRQAKDLLPGNAAVLATLATALDKAGKKEAAEREYKAALDIDGNNVGVLNNFAFMLADTGGDLNLALSYALRAKQLLPNADDISDTLGWVYLKKNMIEEAIGILRDVVQKDPTRPAFRYHLAIALEQKGDHAAAIQELKTTLKNNPSKDDELKINELIQRIEKVGVTPQ